MIPGYPDSTVLDEESNRTNNPVKCYNTRQEKSNDAVESLSFQFRKASIAAW